MSLTPSSTRRISTRWTSRLSLTKRTRSELYEKTNLWNASVCWKPGSTRHTTRWNLSIYESHYMLARRLVASWNSKQPTRVYIILQSFSYVLTNNKLGRPIQTRWFRFAFLLAQATSPWPMPTMVYAIPFGVVCSILRSMWICAKTRPLLLWSRWNAWTVSEHRYLLYQKHSMWVV